MNLVNSCYCNVTFTVIEPNIRKLPTRLNIKFKDDSKDNVLAKMAQETQTMAPSYKQNKAKTCEIHGTVNLGFKRPVHEGYMRDRAAGAPSDHSFFPFSWHLASPRWWEELGIALFHPTIPPKVHIPDITHPSFYSTSSLQWYRGASCAPPLHFE